MKRILLALVLNTIYTLTPASTIKNAADNIINQIDPAINLGIVVVDLNTNETLYQRNSKKLFTPASNMKLFSDAAILLALGPDYRFNTKLATNALSIENGTLHGALYLYLPGDPSLTQDDLNSLLIRLQEFGIKNLQGNIILVSNNAAVSAYAPGRMATDNKYSYGAPVAPVVFDENRLIATVNPAYRAGEPAIIEFSALNSYLSIDNQIKTTNNAKNCGVGFNMNNDNQIKARGCIAIGQLAMVQRIPIQNPLRYAQDLIRSRLDYLNIKFDGNIILGSAPSTALVIASHNSAPIKQLMADTLKPSDNLYADSLFLHAAAALHGSTLNWQQAQPVVKNFLQQQTGINLQDAVLIDGSGLSRQDRVSPQQTVDLLRFLYGHFPLSYEYITALPIAGQDGTLQRRFRKPTQQGLLRAKTGTMTGILSLSGYLYTANSHTLAFAIFINKTPGTKTSVSGRYRSLIDSLCDFFLRQKPENHQSAHTDKPNTRLSFQQQATHAEQQHHKYAKWRRIESVVKKSVRNQAITVLFRGDKLILKDNNSDINHTWALLAPLSQKYKFAIMLQSKSAPNNRLNNALLWVNNSEQGNARIWTLSELLH